MHHFPQNFLSEESFEYYTIASSAISIIPCAASAGVASYCIPT